MAQLLLRLVWWHGVELIPIPSAAGQIVTLGRWRGYSTPVRYVAQAELHETAKRNTLTLKYAWDIQTDPRVKNRESGVRWGTSKITWSGNTVKAEWGDDDDPNWNGKIDATLLGNENPVGEIRDSTSVLVKPRPKQQALRDLSLCLDGQCVLSGEQQEAALEAAHIVPVKAGGNEVIANALLLRADLHRLFDSGHFWFDLSKEGAAVKHVNHLSRNYLEILHDNKLSSSTFDRARQALRLRGGQPGGKGLSTNDG